MIHTDHGPLELLKFSPRKTDAELDWSIDINGLAVAIRPAERKDTFFIRWKNVGKESLEVPWLRFKGDIIEKDRDDLLGHVFLKGPGGKLVSARFDWPRGKPHRQNIVLAPGESLEEIIDLWSYLVKPDVAGKYQLSIELDFANEQPYWNNRFWRGKLRSRTLEIELGK